MMKKGILFILVVVVISTAVMSYASNNASMTLQIGNTTATVYGKQAVLDAAPVIIDGRTMVPIRFIAESLDCIVDWDAENKAVTILQYKNFGVSGAVSEGVSENNFGKRIILQIGKNAVAVDDITYDTVTTYQKGFDLLKSTNAVQIDAAPVIINGRTLVPIRVIAENLNCKVDWDAQNKTVTIIPVYYGEGTARLSD
ncbi:MAG TPA: copper amine oxidase N-terminal domain-containing protein [Tenericutes bacterium]|nr:copper amine oxidase N-terminal domain-containing protein [Mycoplasmatota bacterium]